MKARWISHSKSCRSCARAYLRVPGGRFYAWECCGIGNYPWVKHMPDNWHCEHYQPGPYHPRVEVAVMMIGEPIDL